MKKLDRARACGSIFHTLHHRQLSYALQHYLHALVYAAHQGLLPKMSVKALPPAKSQGMLCTLHVSDLIILHWASQFRFVCLCKMLSQQPWHRMCLEHIVCSMQPPVHCLAG